MRQAQKVWIRRFLTRVKLGDEDTLTPPCTEIEFLDDFRVNYNKDILTQPPLQPVHLGIWPMDAKC